MLFDVKGIAQCYNHEFVIASSIVCMIIIIKVHEKYLLNPDAAV